MILVKMFFDFFSCSWLKWIHFLWCRSWKRRRCITTTVRSFFWRNNHWVISIGVICHVWERYLFQHRLRLSMCWVPVGLLVTVLGSTLYFNKFFGIVFLSACFDGLYIYLIIHFHWRVFLKIIDVVVLIGRIMMLQLRNSFFLEIFECHIMWGPNAF